MDTLEITIAETDVAKIRQAAQTATENEDLVSLYNAITGAFDAEQTAEVEARLDGGELRDLAKEAVANWDFEEAGTMIGALARTLADHGITLRT